MKKYRLIKTLVVILVSILQNEVVGQNNVVIRNESHFVANLDFTPSAGVYKQRKNRIINASHNQGFPNEYSEKNITVKGMVEAAVLTIDWWTLFGEPVENYNFQWTSTRKYHISEYGGRLNMTVTRDMVSKYPDLLMRFDAIKPLDIKFKIYWKHNEEAYKKNLHYTFSSSNRNQSVSTNVNTGLLFEPSGKEPLSVPGIRQGKGLQFIDQKFDSYQHYDLNEEQKKSWIVEFNKTNKIIIDQFFVSDIKWPVGEMKAIAELYEQYENGEKKPSPMEIVNEEVRKNQNLTAYNNNDFWGDAFEELNSNLIEFYQDGKVGFKNDNGKIAIPPIFKWATFISKHKIIIAQEFNKEPGLYTTKGVLRLNLNDYRDSKILEETDLILILTYTTGYYVNLKTAEIVFNIPLHGGNFTNSKIKVIPVNKYNYESYQTNVNRDDVSPSLNDMISQGILPRTVYYVMGDFIMKNSGGWTIRKAHFYGVTKSQEIKLFFTGKFRFGF